jgi:hypothetical protein
VAVITRYPLATFVPAAVVGIIGEVPAYLIEGRTWLNLVLTIAGAYFAYNLYLVYARGDTLWRRERGALRAGLRGMDEELLRALPYVLRVLVAGLTTLAVTTLAAGLLVIPGVWIFTRWSLATPVIRREGLGALGAIGRSSRLVRGNFWFVFLTAPVAYYLEEVLIHEGAHLGKLVTESSTWGGWVGGAIVATVAIPLAAFATALTYSSLTARYV